MTSPLLRLLDASHAASSRTCQLLVKRKLLENELLMEGKEVPNYPTNAAVKEYEDAMPAAKKNIRNLIIKVRLSEQATDLHRSTPTYTNLHRPTLTYADPPIRRHDHDHHSTTTTRQPRRCRPCHYTLRSWVRSVWWTRTRSK